MNFLCFLVLKLLLSCLEPEFESFHFILLFVFQSFQGCLYFEVSIEVPGFQLCLKHFSAFVLNIMGLNITKLIIIYFFCFAMCSSFFLKFNNSDDSLSFLGIFSSISSTALFSSSSCFYNISISNLTHSSFNSSSLLFQYSEMF